MKYYFAPMEGITGYVFRRVYSRLFPHIDKYFTAFIAPNIYGKLSSKEKNDILPEHNEGICTIPQMLTNRSKDFIATAKVIRELGYTEVNLNLGCPSRTVVSKGRGSGFLAKPMELDRFLDEIFQGTAMEISIKTRIGIEEPEEFYPILEVFNRYPVKELIIHPRTQQDFYKITPNWSMFREAISLSRHPVCYNGDIATPEDMQRFQKTFPDVEHVMLGRGLLKNPGLAGELRGEEAASKEIIRAFHDGIYDGYREILFGEKPVLFKMKELWSYMLTRFEEPDQYGKKIKKAEHYDRYEEAVEALFSGRLSGVERKVC